MCKTRIVMTGTLLFAAMLLTLSCASTQLTDNWKNSAYTGPAYKKIMVVALMKRGDLRQPVEDEFRRQLKAKGVDAVACYECIPDVDKINRAELAKVGAVMGIEAYIVVRVLRSDIRIESYRSGQPPPGSTGRASMHDLQWWAPDLPVSKRSEVVTIESRLFDAKTADLVWRSTVEAINLAGDGSEISRFVKLVIKALEDEKLVY